MVGFPQWSKVTKAQGWLCFGGSPVPRMLIVDYSILKVVLPKPFQTGLNILCVPIVLPYTWL